MTSRSRHTPPMRALKPKQLLYQTVQEEVKAYIVQHHLVAGDPLPPETELAHQLNISRNSVREAVKALEALGILETRPGTGLFVRDFSFDPILNNLAYGILFDLTQLIDVLQVRFTLEYGMVDQVIKKVTPEQIQQLHAVLDQMREAAEQGHYSADADRAFHQHLYDNVNNRILWMVLDIFWKVMRLAQDYAAVPGPTNPVESYQAHLPIVETLERQDADAMRIAITNHYAGIESRLRRVQEAQMKKRGNNNT